LNNSCLFPNNSFEIKNNKFDIIKPLNNTRVIKMKLNKRRRILNLSQGIPEVNLQSQPFKKLQIVQLFQNHCSKILVTPNQIFNEDPYKMQKAAKKHYKIKLKNTILGYSNIHNNNNN